jgi:hypothetical protein
MNEAYSLIAAKLEAAKAHAIRQLNADLFATIGPVEPRAPETWMDRYNRLWANEFFWDDWDDDY